MSYQARKKMYRRADGSHALTSKYYCFFRDHNGRQRSISVGDLATTRKFGERIVHLVQAVRFNEQVSPQIANWLRGLAKPVLNKLNDMGLLKNSGVSHKGLEESVEEYA